MSKRNSPKNDSILKGIYEQLFNSAGEGLIVSDKEGSIILANPSAKQMFEYPDESMIGLKVENLIPNRLKKQHISHRFDYTENPSKRTMGAGLILFAKRKSNSEFPVEISLNHFKKNDEFYVLAMITDVTRKWHFDNLLRKEKESVQLYLDMASTLFIVVNSNEGIELMNKSAENLLGIETNQVKNKSWFKEFVVEEDIEFARENFIKSVNSNSRTQSNKFEFKIHTKINGIRLISWQNVCIKNEEEKSVSVLFSGLDITDQRTAENKLKNYTAELEKNVKSRTKELSETVLQLGKANRELERRNTKIVEAQELLQKSQELYKITARNFPKGTISVFDKDLNYVFVEGKELYELGVTSEMLIGTNLKVRLSEEVRDQTISSLKEVFKGEAKKIDIKQRESYYLLTAVPLRDSHGVIEQIMVVEQNITESKLSEDNIKNALKKERELGELKTRFVSMASHEFRTPLSTILTSASLLKKYQDLKQFEKVDKHINRIKSSVANLTNILNDFLSLGKLEEGKISLNLETVDVEVLLNEIREEIQSQSKDGQEIVFAHNGKTSSWILDKAILRNICNNLLSNAVKYSNENSKIEFISTIGKNEFIIEVKDQGIGIPKSEQIHIFDRFFRAKNASNIQGTGLGLNIVKKYVELLNGNIDFSSNEETGTSFKVIFESKKRAK